jgi:hypothetical protein
LHSKGRLRFSETSRGPKVSKVRFAKYKNPVQPTERGVAFTKYNFALWPGFFRSGI